jgi:hypothetical protein
LLFQPISLPSSSFVVLSLLTAIFLFHSTFQRIN